MKTTLRFDLKTSGRRNLCMVPCHSCHNMGFAGAKKWGQCKPQGRGVVMERGVLTM